MSKSMTHTSALDRLRGDRRELRDASFDDVVKQLPEEQVLDAAQAGDGFTLIESAGGKAHLVGVPLLVLDWKENNTGNFGDGKFVTAYVKTQHPIAALGGSTNFLLNDGSTGVAKQLRDLRRDGFNGVVVCRRGLSRSEYEVTEQAYDAETGEALLNEDGSPQKRPVLDPKSGKPITGVTYYLDTSA